MNVNVFETLNKINVNDKVESKNGLSYLSWAYAWGEVKKLYPNANYRIYERDTQYGPVNYFTDGRTCWVKTGVIINELEHIEELPVMDFRNKSITVDKVTSFDVNKAIQRSLTKALARHGLGLYIYAGEDLPEEETTQEKKNNKRNNKQTTSNQQNKNVDKVMYIYQYYKEHKDTFGKVLLGVLDGRKNVNELTEKEKDELIELINTSQHTMGVA